MWALALPSTLRIEGWARSKKSSVAASQAHQNNQRPSRWFIFVTDGVFAAHLTKNTGGCRVRRAAKTPHRHHRRTIGKNTCPWKSLLRTLPETLRASGSDARCKNSFLATSKNHKKNNVLRDGRFSPSIKLQARTPAKPLRVAGRGAPHKLIVSSVPEASGKPMSFEIVDVRYGASFAAHLGKT